MIKFKAFIQEGLAPGSEPLKHTPLSLDEIVYHLKNDFSDCAWMIKEKKPFYRGGAFLSIFMYGMVDTSKSMRKSQNTENFYTLILDNHPNRKHFPKRSKSLICSTEYSAALDYARPIVLSVIPSNSSKIGFVNLPDIWRTRIELFNTRKQIEAFNGFFVRLGLDDSDWSSIEKYDQQLKKGDPDAVKRFYDVFSEAQKDDHKHFLESIFKAYGEVRTGHTAYNSSELTPSMMDETSEAWIDGKCLVIQEITEKLQDRL